jgi:hypothetical protein
MDFFKGLNYWEKLTGQSVRHLVYSGEGGKDYKKISVFNRKDIGRL